MSIASYRENVRLGVTNQTTETCFPASLEQISPSHSYPPDIYPYYVDFHHRFVKIPYGQTHLRAEEFADMMDELVLPLGVAGWQEITFSRANTPMGFARVVGRLMTEGFRVAVDVSYNQSDKRAFHTVGLLPTGEKDYVTCASNQVPKYLQGIISLRRLGRHIVLHSDRYIRKYPFNDANITALPRLIKSPSSDRRVLLP